MLSDFMAFTSENRHFKKNNISHILQHNMAENNIFQDIFFQILHYTPFQLFTVYFYKLICET